MRAPFEWDEDVKVSPHSLKRLKQTEFKITIGIDTQFWALLPALNINLHSKTFEFEWLCFSIYIDKL